MGNLSFIVPIINKDKNNAISVHKMLSEEFPELFFDYNEKDNGIAVYRNKKMDYYVTTLWFHQECEEIKDIKPLVKLNPDTKNTISMNYGMEIHTEKPYYRGQIEKFLHKYFKAYTLDEGIHPDYFPPNYKWKLI